MKTLKIILSLILIFIIHFLDIIQMMQDLKILSKQQANALNFIENNQFSNYSNHIIKFIIEFANNE